MSLKAVLFDWDGTIVDTSEATFHCYAATLGEYGIPFDRDAYERTYRPSGFDVFRAVGLAEEHWPDANRKWLERFGDRPVPLLPNAMEALHLLRERNLKTAIVSSGTRSRVVCEIAHHALDPHFEHVICGNDLPKRKPHPEPLLICLERMGVKTDEAAYVGDSPDDILMARAANVFSVGVPGPYPNRDALKDANPDLMADDVLTAVRAVLDRFELRP